MGKKRGKTVVQDGEQRLPRNKQVLQMLLTTVQRYIEERSGFNARQRIRIQQIRSLHNSTDSELPRQKARQDLQDTAIQQAGMGLADVSISEPYFTNERRRQLSQSISENFAVWLALGNLKSSPAGVDQLERLLALLDELLAEYRRFRDQIVSLLQNRRADVKTDARVKFAKLLTSKPEVARLYRELQKRKGELSQMGIAIEFTGGDNRKAERLLHTSPQKNLPRSHDNRL